MVVVVVVVMIIPQDPQGFAAKQCLFHFISDWAKDPGTTMMGIIFEDFIEVQLSS